MCRGVASHAVIAFSSIYGLLVFLEFLIALFSLLLLYLVCKGWCFKDGIKSGEWPPATIFSPRTSLLGTSVPLGFCSPSLPSWDLIPQCPELYAPEGVVGRAGRCGCLSSKCPHIRSPLLAPQSSWACDGCLRLGVPGLHSLRRGTKHAWLSQRPQGRGRGGDGKPTSTICR